MKRFLSILLALTLTLSLCVFVNAAEDSARLVVSDLTQSGDNWIITVDVYYTGKAQALYVWPNDADNFEFVSGKWKIDEDDTDPATIEIKKVNADTREAALALSEPATFTDYKIYTYTIKATGNGIANIGALVKSTAIGKDDSKEVNTTGSKTVTVDKFTPAHRHEYTVLKHDANVHWYECTCGDKQPATAHTAAEVVKTEYLKSDATCSKPAVYYKSCSLCGEKLTETFENGTADASKHVWENKSNDTHHWEECVCGAKQNENVHAFTELKHNSEKHWYECTCGAKNLEDDHQAEEKVDAKYLKSAATCSSPAVYYKSCSVCGEKLTDTFEYGDPDSTLHAWVNKSDDTHHWQECSECGETKNKTEHAFTELKYNSTSHWYECSCGKATTREDHKGGTADCTHKAVCEVCGQEYGNIKHADPLTFVERVEPTEEADGHIAYYYCPSCGKYFLDADAETQITEDMTVIRYNKCDSEGHSMATIDCGSDEYHLMICTNDCGTIMTVPHSYGLNGVCRGCGRVLEVADLDEEEVVVDTPIESTEEVDTDDTNTDGTVENENNPVTGVAFSAVALVAAAAVLIGKRR